MFFKTRLRKADVLFSEYIRELAHWKCAACGKDYSNNHRGLHCSHYWGRGRESTRFDTDNCIALCTYHHALWGHGDERDEYQDYMIKRLGQDGFDMLEYRAHQYQKRDDALIILWLKEEMTNETIGDTRTGNQAASEAH